MFGGTSFKYFLAILAGIFLGYFIPKYALTIFLHSAIALIPWGVTGVAICLMAKSRKESIILGAIYMLVLVDSFLLTGDLKFEQIQTYLFLLVFALIGLVCGVVMGFITFLVKKRLF